MDSVLPAMAFSFLVAAQFAAVIAVAIHPLADHFPRLQPDHHHPTSQATNSQVTTSQVTTVSKRSIGYA